MELNFDNAVTQVLAIEDDSQVGHARRVVQLQTQALGFDDADRGRAALIATELATNLLKHAGRGEIHVRPLVGRHAHGVEILAIDRGPGFQTDTCLRDGYSSSGTQGIGLGAVARQAQVFDLFSDPRGSAVLARVYPRNSKAADYPMGVSQHALNDDPDCGDTWRLRLDADGLSALMIDGLGHGSQAAQAAQAGAHAFADVALTSPEQQLPALHRAMAGSRGGAAAIARYRHGSDTLSFAGVGNISASLVGAERMRGLASQPGIVGGQFRQVKVMDYPNAGGQLLIMHSDGLQSRWRLDDYPGLRLCHPALIAGVLHRDFSRGRDDIAVLVLRLGSGW